MIEISTDDFATYANQEALVQLKVVSSENGAKLDTLFFIVKFVGDVQTSESDKSNKKLKIPPAQIPTLNREQQDIIRK